MSIADDDFLQQLRGTFRIEAAEHLQAIANGLMALEKGPPPAAAGDLVEAVFRAAHSLKGAARAVDFIEIESQCQALESIFAAWRRPDGAVSAQDLDTAHRMLSMITRITSAPVTGALVTGATSAAGPRPGAPPLPRAPHEAALAVAEPPTPSTGDTVRIAVAKLDARLVEAEEMLAVKLTMDQRSQQMQELARRFELWRGEWAHVEPQAGALRRGGGVRPAPGATRVLDFLEWNLDYVRSLERTVQALAHAARQDRHVVGKLVDDLLEDSKQLLLLPFATLSAPLPKLVRDLCRDQGKDAALVLRGDEVEMDKRVLEEMKDPLMHLLRNGIDHGVEASGARERAGKPAQATITVAVSRINGSKIELLVSDDGAGIATDHVRESAVRQGLLGAQEARQLSEADVHALVFRTALTTSPIITRLSGRGLGLAIVREKVEALGGTVTVQSRAGQGTAFRILLPAMLATFRGILIESARRLFVVPTFQVERVARVRPDDIRPVEGRDTIVLGGATVALVRLAEVLALPQQAGVDEAAARPVVVLGSGEQRIAFLVDAVLDEQEVLVKPLVKPLSRVRNIAGATVLGTGQVAPILNVADLLKSARKAGAMAAPRAAHGEPRAAHGGLRGAQGEPAARAMSILVAEDSITSRMLIKGILESAGYQVKTAVDGMEAFGLLRGEHFDLLVSDVEMPRLNGFDLTARVRADSKLAQLPVVLVTALETREDRERGIDAGANAYLVKSSFDQSNLVEAVRRLL